MNLFRRNYSRESTAPANFDMLRSGLEVEIARPAVVAITASTKTDGAKLAARGLAESLADTGYTTLLVDASCLRSNRFNGIATRTLEEIAGQLSAESTTDNLMHLDLTDSSLQRTTSQKEVQSVLAMLRNSFDYVVISAEEGALTSFATSFVTTADAVLVAVKTGRRQKAIDVKLAEALNRIGSRFLGVLAIDSSLVGEGDQISATRSATREVRRAKGAHIEKDFARREMAEWPT